MSVKDLRKLAKLEDWPAVEGRLKDSRPVLLLGNGASLAIWDKFRYPSLYDLACDSRRDFHLTEEDRRVFKHLEDTKNFEQVLSALSMARKINQIWSIETSHISECYDNIKSCLFSAVNDIHAPYSLLSESTRVKVRTELAKYRKVYTTNYDLMMYWCYMIDPKSFKDFFWGSWDEREHEFDSGDSQIWEASTSTAIYYIHGALHLFKAMGKYRATKKHVSQDSGASLLDLIRKSKEVPLIVSEGDWRDKKSAILDNPYLAFAYKNFCETRINLVVFGQSLNENYDFHIIDAINKMRGHNKTLSAPKLQIAISIYPTSDSEIATTKARLMGSLPDKELYFFDSRSHPLGDPSLNIIE